MMLSWCTHGVLVAYSRCTQWWCTHDVLNCGALVVCSSWCADGVFHGAPSAYSCRTHGVLTVYPSSIYWGVLVACSWRARGVTHGVPTMYSMVYPWCTHGVLMVYADGEQEADFAHMSRVFGRMLAAWRYMDVVPTDIAAGLILLRHVQKAEVGLVGRLFTRSRRKGWMKGGRGGGGGGTRYHAGP